MANARIAPPEIRARRISLGDRDHAQRADRQQHPDQPRLRQLAPGPGAEQPSRPLVPEQPAEDRRHDEPHQDRRRGLHERLGNPEHRAPEDASNITLSSCPLAVDGYLISFDVDQAAAPASSARRTTGVGRGQQRLEFRDLLACVCTAPRTSPASPETIAW